VNREQVSGSTITVVIADDDPIVRHVLTQALEAESGFTVLASEPDSERTVAQVTRLKPDILLVDLFLPKVSSVYVAVSYRSASTRPVIMCSTFEQRSVLDALERGAVGVWMKEHLDILAECLRCVASGRNWNRTHASPDITSMFREIESATPRRVLRLTSREQEVVLLTSSGMTNREIAEHLDIKQTTVQRHLTNMFDKLGMRNRGKLARFVLDHGLISPPPGGNGKALLTKRNAE
jgi:DNA-binding NarL/FixJ family response regulator